MQVVSIQRYKTVVPMKILLLVVAQWCGACCNQLGDYQSLTEGASTQLVMAGVCLAVVGLKEGVKWLWKYYLGPFRPGLTRSERGVVWLSDEELKLLQHETVDALAIMSNKTFLSKDHRKLFQIRANLLELFKQAMRLLSVVYAKDQLILEITQDKWKDLHKKLNAEIEISKKETEDLDRLKSLEDCNNIVQKIIGILPKTSASSM